MRVKIQTKAAAYGIAALALAGAVVILGGSTGFLPLTSPEFNPRSSAVLSILLTDPPSIPEGVSAVFVTYSSLAVHINGLGDSGWVNTGAEGTFNALDLLNLTQTISSGTVPSGSYDMVRLTISEVQVTFMGQNYSATVNSGRLTIPIVGGLKVNNSVDSAAVIDIQPTVLDVGNQTAPQFVITAGAKALQVPSDEVGPEMRNVGSRVSFEHRPWFGNFTAHHSDNLSVESAALSATSFNLSLFNPTSDQVVVKMIVITQGTAATLPGMALGKLADSAVFYVGPDGTMHSVSLQGGLGNGVKQLKSILQDAGRTVPPGGTATFVYAGSYISTTIGVTPGSDYQVLVIGQHLLAAETVQAS